jgi:phosphohistidine phosphatase SixA
MLLTGVGLLALMAQAGAAMDEPVATAQVVILFRHAEAVYPAPPEAPRDPPLNVMGQARADALARVLSAARIERIFSSDYRRTRETVAPLAAERKVKVELYDPRDLGAIAATVREAPGRCVVAGHSNTTPELVALLGGDPGPPIDEKTEYDRLYVLTFDASGGVSTLVLRYGAPLPEDWAERASQRR